MLSVGDRVTVIGRRRSGDEYTDFEYTAPIVFVLTSGSDLYFFVHEETTGKIHRKHYQEILIKTKQQEPYR